ncbi:MAG: type VI secretion system tip protein VgrG, partial [Pseudomonadota bacterium]|nr:type VI secretion system tip protein VgrG [Pseudomonadota bacterium]
ELTTDAQLALRAGRGMLLSAWKRLDGGGKLLDRTDYLALMEDCLGLFRSLGQFAAQHLAMPIDEQGQGDVQAALKQWENGSNTAAAGADGGAAAIGITAPDGISFASAKTIVSYAARNIDSVAQQHLQMTAGQRFNVNAGKGVSLFAHHDGISAIAYNGKMLLQSQHDDTEINSARNCKVTAAEGKVTVMAKEIELIAEDGSFIKFGNGSFTFGSKTPLKFHAPDFDFDGPTTLATAFPTFGDGATDLKFIAKYYPYLDGGLPAADLAHKIANSAGECFDAKTDAAGKSTLLKSDVMHIADIDISDPTPDIQENV